MTLFLQTQFFGIVGVSVSLGGSSLVFSGAFASNSTMGVRVPLIGIGSVGVGSGRSSVAVSKSVEDSGRIFVPSGGSEVCSGTAGVCNGSGTVSSSLSVVGISSFFGRPGSPEII